MSHNACTSTTSVLCVSSSASTSSAIKYSPVAERERGTKSCQIVHSFTDHTGWSCLQEVAGISASNRRCPLV